MVINRERVKALLYCRRVSVVRLDIVDLVIDTTGIRLIGSDTENRVECAIIRMLNYADESNRSVADSIASECDSFGSVVSYVFI